MLRERSNFALILLCFLLSGLAALLYQTVWMRYFSIAFGTSELAVVTVLAAYMGGLALGAMTIARFQARVRRPVRLYAWLEVGIAASALFVPVAMWAIRAAKIGLLGGLDELPNSGGIGKALFFFAAGFVVLLIPTALMGATLPILAKGVVRKEEQIGGRIGLLYGINTTGAVGGTLLAAFVLIPTLGLRATVWVGVAANILAGALGLLVAARLANEGPSRAATIERPAAETRPSWSASGLYPIMMVSGAIAFSYEVLWTRMLGHVVGGSVAAFATMLASFLGGIALGSLLASYLARTRLGSLHGFVVCQLGVALLSWVLFENFEWVLALARQLHDRGNLGHASVAIAALLPVTVCLGATFPFAVRAIATGTAEASRVSARVYGWNTLGAIVGVVVAGFYLIPRLGYEGMLTVAVAGNLLLASSAWLLTRRTAVRVVLAALPIVVAAVFLRPATPYAVLQTSPLIKAEVRAPANNVLYHAVGRSGDVVVVRERRRISLKANGLPEATFQQRGQIDNAGQVARWLGVLPAVLRPNGTDALVIGFGSGQTIAGMPSSIRNIDVVELEQVVIEANRRMAERRREDPLRDPRVRLVINDARGALALTRRTYHAIVSQPSHPWTAGASHLFTKEFYEIVREHLEPDGVFVQWMSASFIEEELARSLLATIHSVFPEIQVYVVSGSLIVCASTQPLPGAGEIAASAGPNGSLEHRTEWRAVAYVEDFVAPFVFDRASVEQFSAGAPVSTDDLNLIAFRSTYVKDGGLASRLEEEGSWVEHYALARPEVAAAFSRPTNRWSTSYFISRARGHGSSGRENAILARQPPLASMLSEGRTHLALNDLDGALQVYRRALALDPDNLEARRGFAHVALRTLPFAADRDRFWIEEEEVRSMSDEERTIRRMTSDFDPDDKLLMEMAFSGAHSKWDGVRAAGEALSAGLSPRLPSYFYLAQIYAWSLSIGAPPSWDVSTRQAHAETALSLANDLLALGFSGLPIDKIRAEAAARANDEDVFIESVRRISEVLYTGKQDDVYRAHAVAVRDLIQRHVNPRPDGRSARMSELLDELGADALFE